MITYGIAVAIGFWLAWMACGSRKAMGPVVYTGFAFLACVGFVETLGGPRPHELEWRDLTEATVLSYKLDEPDAIYLWIDGDTPTAYQLPWSDDNARGLHEASRQAEEQGVMVQMDTTPDDDELVFHPQPVQPLPPKAH